MIITINSLPPKVVLQLHDEKRARIVMNNHLKRVIQDSGLKLSLISMDLKYQSYTFKL